MKPVVVISAVRQETALLEQALQIAAKEKSSPFPFIKATLGPLPVFVCVGGIGKINAAAATAVMLERFQPQLVINTGCAGAYPTSALSIGDLVVASEEILGDEGAFTSHGWFDLNRMGIPSLTREGRRYYNEIPLSRHAAEKAVQLAEANGIKLMLGKSITVSSCSGSIRQGEEIMRRYSDAVSESMEGAAVALTCLRYGVNCLEIRGISNIVEERNLEGWDIPLAVTEAQRFVIKYLEEISTHPYNCGK